MNYIKQSLYDFTCTLVGSFFNYDLTKSSQLQLTGFLNYINGLGKDLDNIQRLLDAGADEIEIVSIMNRYVTSKDILPQAIDEAKALIVELQRLVDDTTKD